MEMMFSFFADVERKGPGSEASTLKALSLLKNLPTNPRIVEFGCGTGVASIPLARSLDCELTVVEIHQPFLDKLAENASREGVCDRIKTVQADMGKPPFPENSFDVIWSEAAIYNVGFEHGLRLWKPLLRSGGYIAVSEVVWLTEEPQQKAKEFWDAEYPSMTTVDGNLATMRKVGFNPVDHFVLPSDDWQSYYGPLTRACHRNTGRVMLRINPHKLWLTACRMRSIFGKSVATVSATASSLAERTNEPE